MSELLRTWRVDAPLPLRFEERVWRRISQEQESRASVWSEWLGELYVRWRALLMRPAGATAYLLALLVVGGGLGYWQSEHYTSEAEAGWRGAYVRSVNPTAISFSK